MKKSTRILFALVAVMLLASACSQPAAPTAPVATQAPAAAAPAAEPAAPAEPVSTSGSTVTLKIGYSTNEEDPRGLASKRFKEIVEQASGGSIIVEIYPSGQLGGDAALIEAMALDSGMVDIIITDASNFATYDAKMGVSALPFLFKDFETAWKFMDSDLVAGVEEALIEQNMRVLAHFCNGFRCVTTSKGEVLSPADMKGMLIRTPENPVIMATMRALGANPQPLAFSELYIALQQGTYDAQENPVPVIFNNKLYEVQKYLSITNHIYSGMCFTISESIWQTMSAEQQQLVADAAKEVQTYNRELNKQMTEDFLAELEAKGMVISHPDLAPFSEATASVANDLSGQYGTLLDDLKAWLAENQ